MPGESCCCHWDCVTQQQQPKQRKDVCEEHVYMDMWLSINAEFIHFMPAKNQNFDLHLTFSTGWIFPYIYTDFVFPAISALTDYLGSPIPSQGKNQTGES